jgi:hypothetical protein
MTMVRTKEESQGHQTSWDYKEEPDVVPAERPPEATPAPAATLPEGSSAPQHGREGSQQHPMPWDYQEEPDVEGDAS